MKIRKKFKITDIVILLTLISIGISLGYIFNDFLNNFKQEPILDSETFYILILLAGFQVGTSIGLLLNPKTKMGGILMLSIALIILLKWYTYVFFQLGIFFMAIILSVSLSTYSIVTGKGEKVPMYISGATLTSLLVFFDYYLIKLFISQGNVIIVLLVAFISTLVYIGCIKLIQW